MTHCHIRIVLAAASAALIAMATPAFAAPSRAELEASLIRLENELAESRNRLRALEEVTGGAASESFQQQLQSIQAELVRVVGELEEAQFQNSRLRNDVRTLWREIQLRDAEIAEKLGLEPAFTAMPETLSYTERSPAAPVGGQAGSRAFSNPFLSSGAEPALGEPAGTGEEGLAESDPEFFGEDPFAAARAASVGTLGSRPPLSDDPATALAEAKRLLVDGRFDDAEAAFAEFQERFGDSPEAGEALYWQGEARFLRGEYEQAKDLYISSLRNDPAGPRAPDAMIALASSLQNMSLNTEACSTLASFPRQYPNAALSVRSKAERVRQAAGCR
jgi:tol-pal system protein YbgF